MSLTTAANWEHRHLLALGWIVLDNGYALAVRSVGERPDDSPYRVHHPSVRVGMEPYLREPAHLSFGLPWRIDVLGPDMVRRRVSGAFASVEDAEEIAAIIRAGSGAWDAP